MEIEAVVHSATSPRPLSPPEVSHPQLAEASADEMFFMLPPHLRTDTTKTLLLPRDECQMKSFLLRRNEGTAT